MTVRRAGAVVLAGALAVVPLAACGPSADDGAGSGDPGAHDDCAGDRPGPTAVVGLAATDGAERWSRTFGAMGDSFEAGGALVLASIEGEAIGVDPATGDALWCRPGTGPFDNTTDPAGTISVPSGGTVVTLGPGDRLAAYDATTGEDLWSAQAPESVIAVPRIRGDEVLVVDNVLDGTYAGQPPDVTMPVLATFDLATGAQVEGPTEVLTADPVEPSPGDEVAVHAAQGGAEPYQLNVVVTDIATGAERWRLTRHGVGAWADGDQVLVLDQVGSVIDPRQANDMIVAYSAADGTELWSTTMPAATSYVTTGGGLVLWSNGSRLTALDRSTGEVSWTVDHGSPGEGGAETEPGHYSTVVADTDGAVLAGVIRAEEPYRD